jgi:SAM-dependent methyltransferase
MHLNVDPTTLERPATEPWFVTDRASQLDRYERCLRMIHSAGTSFRRALDVGCAQGHFTRRLAEFCDSVVGLDVSPVAIEGARELSEGHANVVFRCGGFDPAAFEGATFDLVCALEVLYYFDGAERSRFIEGVRSVLSPDGVFLMTVNVYGDSKRKRRELMAEVGETFMILQHDTVHRELFYRVELPLIALLEDIHYLRLWGEFNPDGTGPKLNTWFLARIPALQRPSRLSARAHDALQRVARRMLSSRALFRCFESASRALIPGRGRNQLILVAKPR